jgi:hypothetical protein
MSSWDIFVQHLPAGIRSVGDIPDDYVGEALGKRDAVIERIGSRFPDCDFSDPDWGRLVRADYAIDITMTGQMDEITGMTLHVRGSDRAVEAVTQMIELLGARGLDSWTGEIYDPSVAVHSIRRWRAYLDEHA